MMKTLTLASLLALLGFNVSPQATIPEVQPVIQTEIVRPRPPVILVRPIEESRSIPLKLSELKVNVEVVGKIAVTTYDLLFYNGNNALLEGEFVFPLGEGQTVSRFALDINGRLREGMVVEKDKGRQVFESVVRSMIDPGLLEWTKGNTFKARIYPIPARGYKRVVIAWEEILPDAGAEKLIYRLPLAFKDQVEKFSLDVKVVEQIFSPELDKQNQIANMEFQKRERAWLANFERNNYTPDQQLSFILPRTSLTKTVVVEKDYTGINYFSALGTIGGIVVPKQRTPEKILLLQDVSSSMAGRDQEREWKLIKAWLKNQKSGGEIRLVQFAHAIYSERVFRNSGQLNDLKTALDQADFDGGTSLGALDLTRYQAEIALLISDGISTFGSSELVLSDYPLYTLSSQLIAEHALLRRLANQSGGSYFNLARLTDDEAVGMVGRVVPRIISIGGAGVREVYPQIGEPLEQLANFSGILEGESGELVVLYGTDIAPRELRIPLKADPKLATTTNGIVRRIWAQQKIANLEPEWKKNEAEIIKLAKTFGIVTRGTSLIVLERIEDYVKHRIVPPVELQAEYYGALAEEAHKKEKIEAEHIEDVIRRFNLLQNWYDKSFPKDRPPEKGKSDKFSDSALSVSRTGAVDRPSLRDSSQNGESYMRAESQPESEEMAKSSPEKSGAEGGIELKKWSPDTPYLKELAKAPKGEAYRVYLRLKQDWANSSAFYLDVADYFVELGEKETALRILSNIAEMELENPQLLRILGHRLAQLGWLDASAKIFEEVLTIRADEPQSLRDLALVLDRLGESQRAADLLYRLARTSWDTRFGDIELIALIELNGMISRGTRIDLTRYDPRVIRAMPMDLRVVLNWDADNTDIDLWITDPNNEKCYYANKLTYQGGRISFDFTRGYGPEEFLLKDAKSGKYQVEANYYGNTQQKLAGATTIQLQLFLNWGRPNQELKEITLRLKDRREVVKVGDFVIK